MRIDNRLRVAAYERGRPELIVDIAALRLELSRETAIDNHRRVAA
jgi:hypothetical protein